MPPNEEALRRWIAFYNQQGKQQEAVKCYQDVTEMWEEHGSSPSDGLHDMIARTKQPALALISPFQPFEGILGKTRILENQEMQRASRRHMLQQILGVVAFAQFPLSSFSPLTAQNDSIEEFLSCCEENILACWRLMKGNEITVVPSVLCTWLPSLEPFARQSAPYQKQSASLAVQGYIIAGLVRVLQRDYDGAEWCCKQALEYSEIAQDPNLKVAALKHLATKYNDAGYHLKTLRTYQEALPFAEQISPLLQSRISLGLALAYARCQKEGQAWHYYELAQESFPEYPEYDSSFPYADCGKSSLNHYGGLMHLEFGQPEKAWELFQQVVQLQQQTVIPERTVIEIVNCKVEAAIAQKDLDRACAHLQEGIQGATRLKSEMRFHDSTKLYQKAQAVWPHEPALRNLGELFH
jgi:tetratricopeptide (TPR) repeat protein